MNHVSRRKFLQNVGLGSSLLSVSNLTLSANNRSKPNDDKKLNVALCGLGRYADAVAYGLESSNYCCLNGLISGTPSKAAEWAKKYRVLPQNVYNYHNFDDIIHNKDIDLVYVLLPNALHKEYVIRAAKAKKHVIVEKPRWTRRAGRL